MQKDLLLCAMQLDFTKLVLFLFTSLVCFSHYLIDVVKLLMQKGANLTTTPDSATPLQIACKHNYSDIFDLLIAAKVLHHLLQKMKSTIL